MIDKLICIDPGHGGRDPGALSPDGQKESIFNLKVSRRLHDLINLVYQGKAILTRAEDSSISLADRVGKSNSWRAKFFLSVHHNSSPQPARGFEVWVYRESDEGERLGKNVLEFLHEVMPDKPNRGIKWTDDFYVLKNTNCPACLVELGFLNDDSFVEWFQADSSQNALAWALAKALVKTMNGQ